MSNKITKKERFAEIMEVLNRVDRADLAAVMEHELELLAKKNANRSSKPTVRQAENAEIKAEIVKVMESGKWYRCAEVKSLIPALAEGEGTQRTARLCNDLVDDKALVKTTDEKVVYFALAE